MRVSFFTKYTRAGPSSRYRFYMYIPFLERAGIQVETYPLLGDQYIDALFNRKKVAPQKYLKWLLDRLLQVYKARSSDLLYIEYELFPYLPFVLERLFYPKRPRVIVEFDDAVHIRYRRYPGLKAKVDELVRRAAAVVVANRFLYDYAVEFNPNVCLLPLALDLSCYPLRKGDSKKQWDRVVMGWIGTPVTSGFLSSILEALQRVTAGGQAVLRCIGVPPDFRLPGVSIQRIPWSESTEMEELQSCHIGIMPLPQGEFESGKSGLKLIQYMACGLASVATAVGVSREIIVDGENGFLALSQREWVEKLERLIEGPALRESMGLRARKTVEERHSLAVTTPKLIQLFREVAE